MFRNLMAFLGVCQKWCLRGRPQRRLNGSSLWPNVSADPSSFACGFGSRCALVVWKPGGRVERTAMCASVNTDGTRSSSCLCATRLRNYVYGWGERNTLSACQHEAKQRFWRWSAAVAALPMPFLPCAEDHVGSG